MDKITQLIYEDKMRNYFKEQVENLEEIISDAELRLNIISQLRLLFQQIDFSLLDWIAKQRPAPECQPTKEIIDSLRQPADGTLIDALEALLISCEQLGWSGSYQTLLTTIPNDNPAIQLCEGYASNLLGLLRGMTKLRNDGAEGHGLPGGYSRAAEIEAYKLIVEGLSSLTPELDVTIVPILINEISSTKIDILPPVIDGRPQLIRKIKIINNHTMRLETQAWDGKNSKTTNTYERKNIFKDLEGSTLPSYTIWDSSWEPACYIPDRAETFSGRTNELNSLFEWANDSDSWACLVFGDGGLGKTSLVIEFLHLLLNEDARVSWKPKVISFYTAKKTQWGINGLEPIKAGTPQLSELIRHLYVLTEGKNPPTEYYRKDVFSTAQMLRTLRSESELNASREDHLIIIDNAETLIERDEDRIALGKELKEITKRLGRILVTSRRYEIFEAHPIAVGSFTENEVLEFLRSRGKNLGLKVIEKSTAGDLIKTVSKMGNRPLILEVFLLTLTNPAFKTLEKARTKVESMLQKDLGEFLFADAWSRFSPSLKKLLLLITGIADVCDGHLLKICASVCGVSSIDAERSLDESKGIGSISNISGNIQITFSTNFLQFAEGQRNPKPGSQPIITSEDIAEANRKYRTIIEANQRFSGDRIVNAFRTSISKAAHRARQGGDFQEALRLYEQAVAIDNNNGWLFDRYAYFLFHDMRDMDAALHQSKKAVSLLPNESEVWLTRGVIESRLGDIRSSENSLDKAESLGAPKIRCDLQRCWAYLKAKPMQLAIAKQLLSALDQQAKHLKTESELRARVEIERLRNRIIEVERR